jgi:hypothetical protein
MRGRNPPPSHRFDGVAFDAGLNLPVLSHCGFTLDRNQPCRQPLARRNVPSVHDVNQNRHRHRSPNERWEKNYDVKDSERSRDDEQIEAREQVRSSDLPTIPIRD